jgi:hypothetical protein
LGFGVWGLEIGVCEIRVEGTEHENYRCRCGLGLGLGLGSVSGCMRFVGCRISGFACRVSCAEFRIWDFGAWSHVQRAGCRFGV